MKVILPSEKQLEIVKDAIQKFIKKHWGLVPFSLAEDKSFDVNNQYWNTTNLLWLTLIDSNRFKFPIYLEASERSRNGEVQMNRIRMIDLRPNSMKPYVSAMFVPGSGKVLKESFKDFIFLNKEQELFFEILIDHTSFHKRIQKADVLLTIGVTNCSYLEQVEIISSLNVDLRKKLQKKIDDCIKEQELKIFREDELAKIFNRGSV